MNLHLKIGSLLFALAAAGLSTCSGSGNTPTGPRADSLNGSLETVTLSGTGDLASCNDAVGQSISQLFEGVEGLIFTTGDNVYDYGTEEEFAKCYDPLWGKFRERTRPSPGNHDYYTAGAAPYFAYFGENAGPAGRGYYTFRYGAWQIYSLNSNVPAGIGSPQAQWLLEELKRNTAKCTLAYWHHPVFSSGYEGNMPNMRDVWRILNDFDADVVLVGHSHNYERFAPQDAAGNVSSDGIREFVVGTGGRGHTGLSSLKANSEIYNDDTFGILKLTLKPSSYDWEFLPIAGRSFRDTGTGACH